MSAGSQAQRAAPRRPTTGRAPSARRWPGAVALLLAACGLGRSGMPPCVGDGAPTVAPAPAEVRLVAGRVLRGRVAGERDVQGTRMLEVVTDFGTVLVSSAEVRSSVPGPTDPEATFVAAGVRVVRIQGEVERQANVGGDWSPVRWTDAYGKDIVNAPNAILRPGDRVRTLAGGEIDFQLHKDTWIRLAEESEIEIPAPAASPASLILARGRLLHQIDGRPRGATFRVATPQRVLGVRGTRFAVEVGATGTAVLVGEGRVGVGEGPDVAAGQRADLPATGEATVRALTPQEQAGLTVQVVRVPAEALAWIPGGRYTFGDGTDADAPTPTNAPDGEGDAIPAPGASNVDVRVSARVPGFYIDRRECSVEDYAAFAAMRSVPMPLDLQAREPAPTPDRRPVWGVPWLRAHRYACWVGRRLPTEAQWEAAARGRERRLWPWGNRLTPEHEALPAWRDGTGHAAHDYTGAILLTPNHPRPCRTVRPVDEATPDVTPLGVEALASGVPEWTRDWWLPNQTEDRLLPRSPSDDGLRPPGGTGAYGYKIVRGAYLSARWALFLGVDLAREYPESAQGWPGLRCVVETD